MARKKSRSPRGKNIEGDSIKLTLSDMAHGGRALGHAARKTIFVPYTIPGEVITARITRDKGKIAFAEGIQMHDASADRVFPRCKHFGPGRCWGCQFQHIDYKAQLLLKQDVLADQLSRVGKLDDKTIDRAIQPVIASPEQWGYNYHMTFPRLPDGRYGFPREGRGIEAIDECHVLHPDLLNLYDTLDMDWEGIEKFTLMLGSDDATMIILSMNVEDAPELAADFPTSVNIVLPDNEPVNLIGESLVWYHVGGRDFRVTAGSFFRPNIAQIDHLIPTILGMLALSGNESVLDLYAGVGIFSAFIAPRAEVVTLVESYPPSGTDADENLHDFENVDVIEGTVEDVLEAMIDDEARYDIAIVDPPASGMSMDALNRLVRMHVSRIVYVSSEPATLARDALQLIRAGYTLKQLQPLDFAPQTYYLETAALFVK